MRYVAWGFALLAVAVGVASCSDPGAGRKLYMLGSILRDSPGDAAPMPAATAGAGMACFKRGDVVSGLYRNCFYSCGAAGTVAKTIGAAELCPITLD